MNDENSTWRFILSALAIWRFTHLIAKEDGPWDLVARLRARLGQSVPGRLMHCFDCVSLWISMPLAMWLCSGWIGLVVHGQALSGAACLLQKLTGKREPAIFGIETLRIESIEGEPLCAMAKNEAC